MTVNSPEAMIKAIRQYGIIPFFKGLVLGVSIEDFTPKECWFTKENLGPWDWKIEAVREGDIAYGKFLSSKSAFATKEMFRCLMTIRRDQEKYQPKDLAKEVLDCIRENGAISTRDLRKIFSVKKNVMDTVITKLQMGTWTITGDFERCYRGANLEYSGWQIASNTTPEKLFGFGNEDSSLPSDDSVPSWVKRFEMDTLDSDERSSLLTVEQSRERITNTLTTSYTSESLQTLLKLL